MPVAARAEATARPWSRSPYGAQRNAGSAEAAGSRSPLTRGRPSATDFAALHPGCESSLNPVNQARHAQPGRKDMPEVYVYAVEGRTLDQKRALIKDITDAVVRNFKVDPEVVMVQIMESPKTHKAKGGVLFSERKT